MEKAIHPRFSAYVNSVVEASWHEKCGPCQVGDPRLQSFIYGRWIIYRAKQKCNYFGTNYGLTHIYSDILLKCYVERKGKRIL